MIIFFLSTVAEQGDRTAQFNLGMCYARGRGVPQSFERAAEWYQRAAEAGGAAAQYQLAASYERGEGVPKSIVKVLDWYRRAASAGDGDALRALDRLGG